MRNLKHSEQGVAHHTSSVSEAAVIHHSFNKHSLDKKRQKQTTKPKRDRYGPNAHSACGVESLKGILL